MRVLTVIALTALLGWLPAGGVAAQSGPDLIGTKYGERRAWFRDWLASCRPDGSCSALAYIGAQGDLFDHSVRVRVPAPGIDRALVFVGPVRPAANPTILVSVDGGAASALEAGADLGWANAPGDAANEYRVSQSVANLTVIPQMEAGRWLYASWPTPGGGRDRLRFSLVGLRAALAWIETQQAR